MSDYKIFSDSTTDLSPELIREMDVEILPMPFVMNGQAYLNYPDEREMGSKEFYNRLRAGESSSTNQLNRIQLSEAFEPWLKKGFDILYIAFSSGLSGTYNTSCIIARELMEKYPERKIEVVDSLAASMGEGLLVYNACLQKKVGLSLEKLKNWLENNRQKISQWFTVDDLNHLKKSGRASGTAAFFGTMLGIKPVMHVDEEGHLVFVEKVRGRRASLDALVNHMIKTVDKPEEHVAFLSHGDALEDAKYVARKIREKIHIKDIFINSIGPVIGAHSGPGTIALFFTAKHKN